MKLAFVGLCVSVSFCKLSCYLVEEFYSFVIVPEVFLVMINSVLAVTWHRGISRILDGSSEVTGEHLHSIGNSVGGIPGV